MPQCIPLHLCSSVFSPVRPPWLSVFQMQPPAPHRHTRPKGRDWVLFISLGDPASSMAFSTLQAHGEGGPGLSVILSFRRSFSSSGDCARCVTCGRWAQWIWLTSASGRSGPRAPTVHQCPWPVPGPAATSSLSPRTSGMMTRVHTFSSSPAPIPSPPHTVLYPWLPWRLAQCRGVTPGLQACVGATSHLIHIWGVVKALTFQGCKRKMHLTGGCCPQWATSH